MGIDLSTLLEQIHQARKRTVTDYAYANGTTTDFFTHNGMWWTRTTADSGYEYNNGEKLVSSSGEIQNKNADFAYVGIVPAIIISSSSLTE